MKLMHWLLSHERNVVQKYFFVTTPIFYANSSPHLGHLYSAAIADAAQCFQRLQGISQTALSTGTDEHGLKVQQAAKAAGVNPIEICDKVSHKFQTLFDNYKIQYSDFIRTSEKRHAKTVENFFSAINSGGYIYKSSYEGWYCVPDESFLTENQVLEEVLPNGERQVVSKESGHKVEWNSETNYMFKLSSFQDDLLYWLKKDDRIVPARFQKELKLLISNGLHDMSISRPKSRVSWGIPLPSDKDQTTYVWLDALSNYLTVAGYPNLKFWPPDVQIIGKDILRFHGIYWPALLMAAKLEPPEKIVVHSHLQVNETKMSKSLGNVICPFQLLDYFTPDAVRYVLLRTRPFNSDSSWSDSHAIECVNSDLANTLGNLFTRCTSQALNPSQTIPKLSEQFLSSISPTCKSLLEQITSLPDQVEDHFSNYRYNLGIDIIMDMARTANLFMEEEKPWKLKSNPDRTNLDSILFIGLCAIRAAAISLQPIVPDYADDLLSALNIPQNERLWHSLRKDLKSTLTSDSLGPKIIPFQRMKLEYSQ